MDPNLSLYLVTRYRISDMDHCVVRGSVELVSYLNQDSEFLDHGKLPPAPLYAELLDLLALGYKDFFFL